MPNSGFHGARAASTVDPPLPSQKRETTRPAASSLSGESNMPHISSLSRVDGLAFSSSSSGSMSLLSAGSEGPAVGGERALDGCASSEVDTGARPLVHPPRVLTALLKAVPRPPPLCQVLPVNSTPPTTSTTTTIPATSGRPPSDLADRGIQLPAASLTSGGDTCAGSTSVGESAASPIMWDRVGGGVGVGRGGGVAPAGRFAASTATGSGVPGSLLTSRGASLGPGGVLHPPHPNHGLHRSSGSVFVPGMSGGGAAGLRGTARASVSTPTMIVPSLPTLVTSSHYAPNPHHVHVVGHPQTPASVSSHHYPTARSTSSASVSMTAVTVPRRDAREFEVSFPALPSMGSVTATGSGLCDGSLASQRMHGAAFAGQSVGGGGVDPLAFSILPTPPGLGEGGGGTSLTNGAAASISAVGSTRPLPASPTAPTALNHSMADGGGSSLGVMAAGVEHRSASLAGAAPVASAHASWARAPRRIGAAEVSHTCSAQLKASSTNPSCCHGNVHSYGGGGGVIGSVAVSSLGQSASSFTSASGATRVDDMGDLFRGCRIPLNIAVMFNIFVTVAFVAILSIFPLNTVSLRSLEHVTTTLSSSLATTLAESINANLFFLPLTVKSFAATWQLDRLRQAWDWNNEDMPQAMQLMCEISSFSRSTSHLLYLTFASPITGYSAYCSPQYSPHFLVGRYITDNSSQHTYVINSTSFRYTEPPHVYDPVLPQTTWEHTVEFGGSTNPWHAIAIPWYKQHKDEFGLRSMRVNASSYVAGSAEHGAGARRVPLWRGPPEAALGTSSPSVPRRGRRYARPAHGVAGEQELLSDDDAAGSAEPSSDSPTNTAEDGWLVTTYGGVSIVTYSIPIIDYAGNLAIISGALQPEGIISAFPDGLLSAEVGSAMVVDPGTGMVMVNSWGEDTTVYYDMWNVSDPQGLRFSKSKGLYIGEIEQPLMRLAVASFGGLEGLANKPPEVKRWQVKFRDGDSESLAIATRILDTTGKLNLIVIYTLTRSEYTANIDTVRMVVIVSVVVILAIIALVDLVFVYLFLQPLRGVAAGLHDASQLRDGTASVEGRISFIKEVAEMQYHFKVMNSQLMRMKAFLPQGVLYPMSGYSGSDGHVDTDEDDCYARESPRRTPARGVGGVGRDGESDEARIAGPNTADDALLEGYADFALALEEDMVAHGGAFGGGAAGRLTVGGRHGALHLNERVLLDEVNRFRRRYCSTIRFFMHIRETDVAVSVVDNLTAAFMTGIIPSILRHGGVIEIQRPDHLLVSFGAHSRVSMHHTRAAMCALEAIEVVNRMTSIGPRVGCLVDVGEFYVGTCGAEQRHARVAFGAQHPSGTDLIKLSKSVGSQILITQRLASVLDEHLIALPIDSIQYPFSSKPSILYELRGSTKSLSSSTAESDVRVMVQQVKQAFHKMVKGDYTRALEYLLPYEEQDAQVARLANCCRTLIARGVVKPFIRSIGRIKLSDADTTYDITDETNGFNADASRLTMHRGPVRGALSLRSSPQSVGLDSTIQQLTSGAPTRVIEGVSLHDPDIATEGLHGAPSSEPQTCSAVSRTPVLAAHVVNDSFLHVSAPAAAPASDAAGDEENCGALFEMFIDADEDDEVPAAGDGAGYESDDPRVESARASGQRSHHNHYNSGNTASENAGVRRGELPVQFCDYEGNRWTRSADRLGKGAFSVVYRGLSDSGNLVALKCFQLRARNVDVNAITEEVRVFANLHHENIVQYVGIYVSQFHIIEIMEFVPGGSLDTLLTSFGTLGKNSVRRYLRDILKGLQYLHATNIVHCDIKPHNVLLAMDGQCKLSDFGSAIARATTSVCKIDDVLDMRGTAGYMAPEVARGEVPTLKSDVFSLGVTVLELLTGKLPWQYVDTARPVAAEASPGSSPPPQEPSPGGHQTGASPTNCAHEVLPDTRPGLDGVGSRAGRADGCDPAEGGNALVCDYAVLQSPQRQSRTHRTTEDEGGSHAYTQTPVSHPLPIEQVLRNAVNLMSCIARDVVRPAIPEDLDGDVADFLAVCLNRDPAQRATVEELLTHPWMM